VRRFSHHSFVLCSYRLLSKVRSKEPRARFLPHFTYNLVPETVSGTVPPRPLGIPNTTINVQSNQISPALLSRLGCTFVRYYSCRVEQLARPQVEGGGGGSWLEVCWRYWRPPTEEEVAKGEKRKKIGEKIWCEGEVVLVANGTSTLEKPECAKCKKLANAGAVRIRWPADPERKEPETHSWHIFQDALWNEDKHLGWRFTATELEKRTAAAQPAPKRRR
jgi:hypothetical protein